MIASQIFPASLARAFGQQGTITSERVESTRCIAIGAEPRSRNPAFTHSSGFDSRTEHVNGVAWYGNQHGNIGQDRAAAKVGA